VAAFPLIDETLEQAIVAGARGARAARDEAFARLFEALRAPVYSLCLNLTGRPADAEDAVQEVFISVHRALPAFRGEARLSTWVYRIALRAALQVRARQRPSAPLELTHVDPRGEAELLARDEARRALVAMQALPAEHRAVLSLFAIQGLSHREVAQVLGVPEGTIWSRLHTARKRLTELMKGPPTA
jgi:RNA polymerase sigma-70 factor (ECF subfamily)